MAGGAISSAATCGCPLLLGTYIHAALHTDLLLLPAQGLVPQLLPGYPDKRKNPFSGASGLSTGCNVGHPRAQGSLAVHGAAEGAKQPGSTSAAWLCQIPSPPGSAPVGTHVQQLEQHGQLGLDLLSITDHALIPA